uniref:Canavalin n=1 Tax=Canavalia gladiata TaxID=3824 RepID=CANA_CANGL|nr:RecName: Full=Canavalin; Flags: Precursor [Canavalia gladiata]CAA29910.1 unnamed protein product [Canavalia gladiata]
MAFSARFPLWLLLGVVLLASVSASFAHSGHSGGEAEDESEESRAQNNPYLFRSNKFLTLFKNQHGSLRLLQRFNEDTEKLENLRDYRVLEYCSKPNTLLLPHHSDSDLLVLVLEGQAILVLVNPDGRDTYKLDQGDAIKIQAGTPFYLINPDNNQNLRILNFAITFRRPGTVEDFFLSSTKRLPSYLSAFSKNFLEASYDSPYDEIEQTLLQEEQEGVIVKMPKDQIQEISKHAQSSSRKTLSSQDKPFNLRSRDPIYSNNYGKLYEITPEKNSQLRDLDILLNCLQMNEGALFVPHYNSRATVILVANEGRAEVELVGLEQQQQQGLESMQLRRYAATLSEGDILVIPSSFPVALKAASDLNMVGIGVNAENNERNFLAGNKENVIRQIPRQVSDLTFPGSGEEVEELLENQKESYFVDGQPRHIDAGGKARRAHLPNLFRTFY